jgi:hypothetical protein
MSDTTPPVILSIVINPSTIWLDGCGGFDQKSTSTLEVYDENGIKSVSANWTLGSLSGTVNYSSSNGTTWTGQFGKVTEKGTMSINGVVVDNASPGNSTPFTHTLTVKNCLD